MAGTEARKSTKDTSESGEVENVRGSDQSIARDVRSEASQGPDVEEEPTKDSVHSLKRGLWRGLGQFTLWIVWELIPCRFLFEKLRPPIRKDPNKRPPVTIGAWAIGFYIALHGLATQRYENALDRIEMRISSIYTLAGTPQYLAAIGRVPSTQKLTTPIRPTFWDPLSALLSLLTDPKPHIESVQALTTLVEGFAHAPEERKRTLQSAELQGAELQRANLIGANLQFAHLERSNLQGAELQGAKLHFAHLEGARLEGAHLNGAYLTGAELKGAKLRGAKLQYTRLENAKHLTQAQLNTACGNAETQLPEDLTIPTCPE